MPTDKTKNELYLDDINIGDTFVSPEQEITDKQIIDFARQFDPQSFHLDANAATDTFFRGLAASGWHTMSITMKLLTESLPLANGIIGAGGEITWRQPTRPGDILRVESEIIEILPSSSRPQQGLVTVESKTLARDNGIRQIFRGKLIVFRRPTTNEGD